MKAIINKPDLTSYFISMPLTSIWLKSDYNKANTLSELTALMHKWFNEAETTKNKVKQNVYKASAYYLYSVLTGQSFESKINIQ